MKGNLFSSCWWKIDLSVRVYPQVKKKMHSLPWCELNSHDNRSYYVSLSAQCTVSRVNIIFSLLINILHLFYLVFFLPSSLGTLYTVDTQLNWRVNVTWIFSWSRGEMFSLLFFFFCFLEQKLVRGRKRLQGSSRNTCNVLSVARIKRGKKRVKEKQFHCNNSSSIIKYGKVCVSSFCCSTSYCIHWSPILLYLLWLDFNLTSFPITNNSWCVSV